MVGGQENLVHGSLEGTAQGVWNWGCQDGVVLEGQESMVLDCHEGTVLGVKKAQSWGVRAHYRCDLEDMELGHGNGGSEGHTKGVQRPHREVRRVMVLGFKRVQVFS